MSDIKNSLAKSNSLLDAGEDRISILKVRLQENS